MFEVAAVKAVLGVFALVGDRLFHRTKVRKDGRYVRVRRTHTGLFATQKRAIGTASYRLGVLILVTTAVMVAQWVRQNEVVVVMTLMVGLAVVVGALLLALVVYLVVCGADRADALLTEEEREVLRQQAQHQTPRP